MVHPTVIVPNGVATLEARQGKDGLGFRALIRYLPTVGPGITHLSEGTFATESEALAYAQTWATALYPTL